MLTTQLRLNAGPLCAVAIAVLSFSGCPEPEPTPGPSPHWQQVAGELPEALLSISGSSGSNVWAVGADKGQGPLVLHYDGASWTRVNTGTHGDLWWVHVLPDGEVWMAGANATVLRGDGTTFTRVPTPGFARDTLFGLWGSSAEDIWVAGSSASRNGFIWHFDGATWKDMPLPSGVPTIDHGDLPGLFKVWGDGRGTVWATGGKGVLLRSVSGGPFTHIPSASTGTFFTVHGLGERVVTVGGAAGGVIGEAGLATAWTNRTPDAVPLLQGVYVASDGTAWATGQAGTIVRRNAEGIWETVDHDLPLRVESLHAVWVDPDGNVWAVGGDVLSSALDDGAIIRLGMNDVATYAAPKPQPPPPASCPVAQIDPAEGKTIARRWNEQNLWAIRRDIPRPGVHARNLFHVATAMYDAWTAFDATADGYFFHEKHSTADVDAARHEAISYAAYRVLDHRYSAPIAVGAEVSQACFRAFMEKLGYDPDDTVLTGDSPRAIGNRIGAAIVEFGASDGANEAGNYADTTGFSLSNPPLVVDQPGARMDAPSKWQPMVLAQAVTQNGIPVDAGAQGYIGAQWGKVTPFAMSRSTPDALYYDPGPPPEFGPDIRDWVVEVILRSSQLDPGKPETMDISPGAFGNNALGTNDGTGYALNPVTGEPYVPQVVKTGDLGRVLAEFWADGPKSETPPGHWNVLANEVADNPLFERRLEGLGEVLDPLEWDVKLYFALNGATHDAAIAAWEIKRAFACSRPISLIRYMAEQGQSSDPNQLSYDPEGLPLVPGLIEVITLDSSRPGQQHAHLARYIGQVAVRSWRGEPADRLHQEGGVDWIRGVDWIPYQLRTFVTPAFPGFISGHSTFSRAGAEVLTRFTGSPWFPGGLGEFVAKQNKYLTFELGPSTDIRLQWASYYDAADQAGQSRIWGGIHIAPDDFVGRTIGSSVGIAAADKALTYFSGTAVP